MSRLIKNVSSKIAINVFYKSHIFYFFVGILHLVEGFQPVSTVQLETYCSLFILNY